MPYSIIDKHVRLVFHMSHFMSKPAFCTCKKRAADQHLSFHYIDSMITLLPKSVLSSLYPSSMVPQPCLCPTWSETPKTVFKWPGSYNYYLYSAVKTTDRKHSNNSYITSKLQNKWATLWENLSSWFPTRSDKNRAVQPQKMVRGLKFHI